MIQNDAHLVGYLLAKGAIARSQYAGKPLLQWAVDNKRSSTVLELLNDYHPAEVCCSVLQCGVVWCRVLRRVTVLELLKDCHPAAVCCSVL